LCIGIVTNFSEEFCSCHVQSSRRPKGRKIWGNGNGISKPFRQFCNYMSNCVMSYVSILKYPQHNNLASLEVCTLPSTQRDTRKQNPNFRGEPKVYFPSVQASSAKSASIIDAILLGLCNMHCLSSGTVQCVISGFRHELDKTCAFLLRYAACGGNSLPTFRDNLSGPSPRVKKSLDP